MTSTSERLAALEEAVARLTARVERAGAPVASAIATPDVPAIPSAETAVETAVETAGETAGGAPHDDPFWLLQEVLRRRPDGALDYAGHLQLPHGPVRWQRSFDPDALVESDWHQGAARLDALSHPVRLRLLQLVLTGTETTAAMAQDDELGTTGQLHHHLRQLVAAGWLTSVSRGRYAVPAQRVVPLLLIVAAATE
ncbi:hypothetical protein BJY21_004461 [Kineosphaera limosa]|uniref:ArsR family transcriptional regulator n=1 Tax=Kineosphaera limosa NBRC 100340 TaxID=1184609 RepID=K6WAH0_9MICO|nr:helix-turn-helix domain-containing protein [Kineosphaera limosa]NYE03277.1 hypothetical protein [Kineosphaera limosa]GAB96200.1 hypothetical protein KILIM_033_00200 [Kineosphaera limosa NBRC 100340]